MFSMLLFILLIIDYLVHLKYKKYFTDILPKDILADIDEDIELPEIKSSGKIPKNIYRTYYSYEAAKNFESAKEITRINNPNLSEIFYDDTEVENFIKKKFSSRIYNAYKKINPQYGPARADFFRYLIIYLKGGVYLDIKSYIKENIDEELNIKDKLIISKGRDYSILPNNFGIIPITKNSYNWEDFSNTKHGEINNWHFMAPPGNEILKKTIQQVVSNIEYGIKNKGNYEGGEYSVLALTGPIMFSRTVLKYMKENNCILKNPRFDSKIYYCINNHKKINKNHYSKLKEKNILIY